MLPTREWRNELRPISPQSSVGMQRNRKPRIGRPDTTWHKKELNKQRESVIEDWLASRTARSLTIGSDSSTPGNGASSEHNLDGSSTFDGSYSRSSSFNRSRSRSRSPRTKVGARRKEVPRFYDSIADYLVRLETISKVSKYQAHVDTLREIREESSKSLISDKSRELASKKRLRKAVELFQTMDVKKEGGIILDDVDDELLDRLQTEQDRAFVLSIFLPFAQSFSIENAGQTCVISLDQFVALAMDKMQTPAATKPTLSRERSISSTSALEMSFHPEVNDTSVQIVRARRESISHDQLIHKWIEEKSAWEKNKHAKAQKLVEESLAECTFKPSIKTHTPSNLARLLGPTRKPIKGEAAMTSEEREYQAHCTFSPRVARTRSVTPGRLQTM